jgi:hypothetical protein
MGAAFNSRFVDPLSASLAGFSGVRNDEACNCPQQWSMSSIIPGVRHSEFQVCEALRFIFNASVVHHDDFQQQLGHVGYTRFWIVAESRLWGLVIMGFPWLFRGLN